MSEYRQNMATNEWVIISPERAKRPEDFQREQPEKLNLPEYSPKCPFCKGNEHLTPPPTLTIERNGSWSVRAVPNKFAALQKDVPMQRDRSGKFLKASGYGIAEVIIETPVHNLTLATMALDQVKDIVSAFKQRYLDAAKQDHIALVTIFRNHGVRAGTSLEHAHAQLIATPIIPPHVRNPIETAMVYHDSNGTCIYCDMLAEELRLNERIVLEDDHFVAFAPFASRTPFEMRIIPKTHRASFGDISGDEMPNLACFLQSTLAKIYWGLNNPDYNLVIRSAPVGDEAAKYYHWYMVIIPKLTTPAGFEIGTGIYINITYPEECATFLKKVSIPDSIIAGLASPR